MQMSKTYDSTSRSVRAAQARSDAEACERAGYPGFAQVNRDIAGMLDPWYDREDQDQIV
jgi:hypothetical protein